MKNVLILALLYLGNSINLVAQVSVDCVNFDSYNSGGIVAQGAPGWYDPTGTQDDAYVVAGSPNYLDIVDGGTAATTTYVAYDFSDSVFPAYEIGISFQNQSGSNNGTFFLQQQDEFNVASVSFFDSGNIFIDDFQSTYFLDNINYLSVFVDELNNSVSYVLNSQFVGSTVFTEHIEIIAFTANSGGYIVNDICIDEAFPDCFTAEPIYCGQTLERTTINAENNYNAADYCFDTQSSFNAGDYIFQFERYNFSDINYLTLEYIGASVDLDISLFEECFELLDVGTQTYCVPNLYENSPASSTNLFGQFPPKSVEVLEITDLPAGSYYIVIDGYAPGQESDFWLSYSCEGVNCNEAPPLECGEVVTGFIDTFGNNQNSNYNGNCVPQSQFEGMFTSSEDTYIFIPEEDGQYTFTLEIDDSNADLELFLLSSCCVSIPQDDPNVDYTIFVYEDSGCVSQCEVGSTQPAGITEVRTVDLLAGVPFYIVVDGFLLSSSGYTLSVDCNQLNCNSALPISCGEYSANNTLNGTNSIEEYINPIFGQVYSSFPANEIIYEFTPSSGGTYDFYLGNVGTGVNSNQPNLEIFILDSCDPNSVLATTRDNTESHRHLSSFLIGGLTYYIIVDGITNTSFELNVNCDYSCEDATPISCPSTFIEVNELISRTSFHFCEGDDPNEYHYRYGGPERYYRFVPEETREYTFNIGIEDLNEDLDIYVLDGCDALKCLGNTDSQSGTTRSVTVLLESEEPYIIVIDSDTNDQSNFIFSLSGCETDYCNQVVPTPDDDDYEPPVTFDATALGFTVDSFTVNFPLDTTGLGGYDFSETIVTDVGPLNYICPVPGCYYICFWYETPQGELESCCIKYCTEFPVDDCFSPPVINVIDEDVDASMTTVSFSCGFDPLFDINFIAVEDSTKINIVGNGIDQFLDEDEEIILPDGEYEVCCWQYDEVCDYWSICCETYCLPYIAPFEECEAGEQYFAATDEYNIYLWEGQEDDSEDIVVEVTPNDGVTLDKNGLDRTLNFAVDGLYRVCIFIDGELACCQRICIEEPFAEDQCIVLEELDDDILSISCGVDKEVFDWYIIPPNCPDPICIEYFQEESLEYELTAVGEYNICKRYYACCDIIQECCTTYCYEDFYPYAIEPTQGIESFIECEDIILNNFDLNFDGTYSGSFEYTNPNIFGSWAIYNQTTFETPSEFEKVYEGNVIKEFDSNGEYDFLSDEIYFVCYEYPSDPNCLEYCCVKIDLSNNCDQIQTDYVGEDGSLEYNYEFISNSNAESVISWSATAGNITDNGTEANIIYDSNGNYQVCCLIYDEDTDCYSMCCTEYCIENPFECGDAIGTEYNVSSGTIDLDPTNQFGDDAMWMIDFPLFAAGMIAGDIHEFDPLNDYGIPLGENVTVSVKFSDNGGCTKICCKSFCSSGEGNCEEEDCYESCCVESDLTWLDDIKESGLQNCTDCEVLGNTWIYNCTNDIGDCYYKVETLNCAENTIVDYYNCDGSIYMPPTDVFESCQLIWDCANGDYDECEIDELCTAENEIECEFFNFLPSDQGVGSTLEDWEAIGVDQIMRNGFTSSFLELISNGHSQWNTPEEQIDKICFSLQHNENDVGIAEGAEIELIDGVNSKVTVDFEWESSGQNVKVYFNSNLVVSGNIPYTYTNNQFDNVEILWRGSTLQVKYNDDILLTSDNVNRNGRIKTVGIISNDFSEETNSYISALCLKSCSPSCQQESGELDCSDVKELSIDDNFFDCEYRLNNNRDDDATEYCDGETGYCSDEIVYCFTLEAGTRYRFTIGHGAHAPRIFLLDECDRNSCFAHSGGSGGGEFEFVEYGSCETRKIYVVVDDKISDDWNACIQVEEIGTLPPEECPSCYESCCGESDLTWLEDVKIELSLGCESGCDNFIDQGMYNGQCVYISQPDCALSGDGGGTVYDCDGQELFGFNFMTGFNTELYDAISQIVTIWTCAIGDIDICIDPCPDANEISCEDFAYGPSGGPISSLNSDWEVVGNIDQEVLFSIDGSVLNMVTTGHSRLNLASSARFDLIDSEGNVVTIDIDGWIDSEGPNISILYNSVFVTDQVPLNLVNGTTNSMKLFWVNDQFILSHNAIQIFNLSDISRVGSLQSFDVVSIANPTEFTTTWITNLCLKSCEGCNDDITYDPSTFDSCDELSITTVSSISDNSVTVSVDYNGTEDLVGYEFYRITNAGAVLDGESSTGTWTCDPDTDYLFCYKYMDEDGCMQYCCIKVRVPSGCDGIVPEYVGSNDLAYNFTYEGSDDLLGWLPEGANLIEGMESGTITYDADGTYYMCCLLWDEQSKCYTICCRPICVEDPLNCEDAIEEEFTVSTGVYDLTVNAGTAIKWEIDLPLAFAGEIEDPSNFNPTQLGIPVGTTITISVTYIDDSGCLKVCCKSLCSSGPDDCEPCDPTPPDCNLFTVMSIENGDDWAFDFDDNNDVMTLVSTTITNPDGSTEEIVGISNTYIGSLNGEYTFCRLYIDECNISYTCCVTLCVTNQDIVCSNITSTIENDFTVIFNHTIENGTTYLWDFGDGNTSMESSLEVEHTYAMIPSTYTVTLTVTDACGEIVCEESTEVEIMDDGNTNDLVVLPTVIDESCIDEADGSISLSISGGVMPYTIVWQDGSVDGEQRTNLTAGDYPVTVSDANGLSISLPLVISAPTVPTITSTIIDTECGQENGQATFSTSDSGVSMYRIINTDGFEQTNSTGIFTDLSFGDYTLIVFYAAECEWMTSFTIAPSEGIDIELEDIDFACELQGSLESGVEDNDDTIEWLLNGTVLPDENQANLLVTESATYTIRVTKGDCVIERSAEVTISPSAEIIVDAINADCGVSNGQIMLNSNNEVNITEILDTDSGQIYTGNTIMDLAAGQYQLQVTDANGCTQQIFELIESTGESVDLDLGEDVIVCSDEDVLLSPSIPQDALNVEWYLGSELVAENVNMLTPTAPGDYQLVVTQSDGCIVDETVHVEFYPELIVVDGNGGPATVGQVIELNVTGASDISWTSTGVSLSCTDCAEQTISVLQDGSVTFNASDINGCSVSETYFYTVTSDMIFPNYITPNGDQLNDVLEIVGVDQLDNVQLLVFDQWGGIIFTAEDYENDWSGFDASGNAVPDGAYYYVLSYITGGVEFEHISDLTILKN